MSDTVQTDTTTTAADTTNVNTENTTDIGSAPVTDTTSDVANTDIPAAVAPVPDPAPQQAPDPIPVAPIAVVQEPVVVPPVAPVVAPIAPTINPLNIAPPVVTDATIEGASVIGNINYQNIIDYMGKMAPKVPVNKDDGSRNQVRLFKSLTTIINTLDTDFNLVFGSALKLFHENADGVFHETHVFRFMEHITLSDIERTAFQRILNLMKLTADPKGRAIAINQINMNATTEFCISEQGKQNLIKFFNK